MTRPYRAALVAIAIVVAFLAVSLPPAGADVSFINSQRAGAGRPPVADSSGLAGMAARHSSQMAAQGSLFHTSGLLSAVTSILPSAMSAGENVGVGSSLAEVNNAFMASATHRANILGDYNYAGVGVYTGSDGRVWVTQVFAKADGAVAAAPRTTVTVAPRTATAPRASRSTSTRSVIRPALVTGPTLPPLPVRVGAAAVPFSTTGVLQFGSDGGVFADGDDALFAGSAANLPRNAPVVGGAATKSARGYLLFGSDGGVFSFGDAPHFGSLAGQQLAAPVVGGMVNATGDGYWLVARDGGVFAFGSAVYAGGAAEHAPSAPIVGGAASPIGDGYWLVGADGAVYSFGDAPFFGSLVGQWHTSPIAAIVPTTSGTGYWLVGTDGAVYPFGAATWLGGLEHQPVGSSIVGLVPALSGRGYRLVAADGMTTSFGDVGSLTPDPLPARGVG